MQVPDTATVVSPEKARALLPMPYVYKGLSVQGVNPTRLTPYLNPNINVDPEVAKAIELRNLARRLTGSELAIATVGLGLPPAALTVSGVVRALITRAGLARTVADIRNRTSTPKPAHPSDDIEVELHIPGMPDIPLQGYETDGPFEVEF